MLTAAIVLAALAGVGDAPGSEFSGKVVSIADGDTLTVLRDGREPVKIRLHGIDCPEAKQDFGTRARQLTGDLAFGRVVRVKPRDTDRYGRTVAEVILPDGRSLNRELVRQGMAWWYRRYAPDDRQIAELEREARNARRGLWSQSNPVPPWEWRAKASTLPPDLAGKVIANARSRVFHKPGCRAAGTIAERNRVAFDDEAAAERAGYRPARDCHR